MNARVKPLVAEEEANPRAVIGANMPPEEQPERKPFDAHTANINDLYDEARNWCDGEPVANDEQAAMVSQLLTMIREAHKAADDSRKAEAKPLQDQVAAIQERYNALIGDTKAGKGKAVLAAEACRSVLSKWLQLVETRKREEADRLRKEAEASQKAAAEAAQAAAASGNLDAMKDAEGAIKEARAATKAADRADKSKAQAGGGFGGRAVGLRSVWTAEITDLKAAAAHYWLTNPDAIRAAIQQLADEDVRVGKRQIPGVNAREDRVAH